LGTDRSSFAVGSLLGKFGGLCARASTFPYIGPLPLIFGDSHESTSLELE
jgi:hypothetical protein